MYKYSIIIPHHNIPNLLQRCLDSIPERKDIQIIVVDDNSSEEQVDFSCFPGSQRTNLITIFDKDGGGAGHARNIGLKQVDAKWVLFADADDLFSEHAFEELDKFSDRDADLVMFKTRSVMSDTLEPVYRGGAGINPAIDNYFEGKMSEEDVSFANMAPWCKLISYDLIKSENILFDEVMYGNDIMFSTKVACAAKKVLISKFELYTITLRPGSLTYKWGKSVENNLCRLKVRIRRNKFLKEQGKKQEFLPVYAIDALKNKNGAFWRIVWLLLTNNMLFAGLGNYLSNKFK